MTLRFASMDMSNCQIIDLDGAWSPATLSEARYLSVRSWGPQLRYCAPTKLIEAFYQEIAERLTPFTLIGSGDYHHLTGLLVRQLRTPFILVSFDNHPDWDTRPPRWCCGTWISRALESDLPERVSVWGCANFELNLPHRLFANHKNLRTGRLEVWPWAERFGRSAQKLWPGINTGNWRQKFTSFSESLAGKKVYVTVDMDCLRPEEAVTDWEQGLFTAAEVAWAINLLRANAEVVAGDICGAHSEAAYVRWTQRKTATMDHPKLKRPDVSEAERLNRIAVDTIWPALIGTTDVGTWRPRQAT